MKQIKCCAFSYTPPLVIFLLSFRTTLLWFFIYFIFLINKIKVKQYTHSDKIEKCVCSRSSDMSKKRKMLKIFTIYIYFAQYSMH